MCRYADSGDGGKWLAPIGRDKFKANCTQRDSEGDKEDRKNGGITKVERKMGEGAVQRKREEERHGKGRTYEYP